MKPEYASLLRQAWQLFKSDRAAAVTTSDDASHQARAAGIPSLAAFFAAMAHYFADEFAEAVAQFDACLTASDFTPPASGWYAMGYALSKQADYKRSVECFSRAAADRAWHPSPANWFAIGYAEIEVGEFRAAARHIKRALAEDTYAHDPDAWNVLGRAHFGKGTYKEALRCFRKALALGATSKGDYWRNCGLAHMRLDEWQPAIDCFMVAIDDPTFARTGSCWQQAGLGYRRMGEQECARAALENAVYEYRRAGDRKAVARVRKLIERPVKGSPVSGEDMGQPESGAGDEQPNLFEPWAMKTEASGADDVLVFLKDWSGSSPYIAAISPASFGHQPIHGGGYFLKWHGRGTVVDPGISFVDNFLKEGFHAREIHHVLTTHSHLDHTADLLAVQNLFKEYYDVALRHEANPHSLLHFWDSATLEVRPYIQTSVSEEAPYELASRNQPKLPEDARAAVEAIDSKHCPSSVALRLDLHRDGNKDPLRVGLSSDAATSAVNDLIALFRGCAVIVLHFSKSQEPDFITGDLKENHLGYSGCIQIIQKTDAELYVIAEFSGERGEDRRIAETKTIALLSGKRGRIVPADIGLSVCLGGSAHEFTGIKCSQCGQFKRIEDVSVVPPKPFGRIQYFCKDCSF